jgi:hypothetical protein
MRVCIVNQRATDAGLRALLETLRSLAAAAS